MNKNWPVGRITRLGLGVALFVVLTMCLQVPVFENYYLCLGYVVMAVYLYSIGTVDGTIVGVAGVILYCVLTNGLRGMPGWALGNVAIGLMMGGWMSCCRKDRQLHPTLAGTPSRQSFFIVSNIIVIWVSCCVGIGLVKSGVESMLYGQPIWARMAKNNYALIADIVVLVIAYPICMLLDKHIHRAIYTPKHMRKYEVTKVRRRFIGNDVGDGFLLKRGDWGYGFHIGKVYTLYIHPHNGRVRVTMYTPILHRRRSHTYPDHGAFVADWARVDV